MRQRNAASNAIQFSAIQFRELNDRAKDYMDKEIRNVSLGEISVYAKECVNASLNPALLHSGSTTRLSSSSRLAHLNSIRQAEIGKAILEDRAMRLPVPLKSSIMDKQGELLQTIKGAQKKGQTARNKFRSRVLAVVAANRFNVGADLAELRRQQKRLSKFRTGVWVVVAISRMRKGLGGQSMIDEVAMTRQVLADIKLQKKFSSSGSRGNTSPTGKRDSSGVAPSKRLPPAAVAKNDFVRIGKMTAKMLRKCRMDNFGENEDRESGGLLDDGEVWLWEHTQRNSAASALAAASLKPSLYEFAASLVGEKADERRRRVVELLRKKCVENLRKVEQQQSKANIKAVFHHDSNDVRANAGGRLALLKALDLAKCDEVVLKEMVAEKKVSDAEIAAEFAEARAVMAAKERRNWEDKQEETLNDMRIEQLKERALALDIELPPTTHTLKIQLISLIIQGRLLLRFPKTKSGQFPEDEEAELARQHAVEVRAAYSSSIGVDSSNKPEARTRTALLAELLEEEHHAATVSENQMGRQELLRHRRTRSRGGSGGRPLTGTSSEGGFGEYDEGEHAGLGATSPPPKLKSVDNISSVSGVKPKTVPRSVIQSMPTGKSFHSVILEDEEEDEEGSREENGDGGGGGEIVDGKEEATLASLEGSNVSHDVETKDGGHVEVIDFLEDIHGGDSERRRSLLNSRDASFRNYNSSSRNGKRSTRGGLKTTNQQREETEKFWKDALNGSLEGSSNALTKSLAESSISSQADADSTCDYLMSKALIAKIPRRKVAGNTLIGGELPASVRRAGKPLAPALMKSKAHRIRREMVDEASRAPRRISNITANSHLGTPTSSSLASSSHASGMGGGWAEDERVKRELLKEGDDGGYGDEDTDDIDGDKDNRTPSQRVDSAASTARALGKFNLTVKKHRINKAKASKMFSDLEMPSAKQISFMAKYAQSFQETAKLDSALQHWDTSAQLVQLREYILEKLKRLEKGEWLEPFEIFSAKQEATLREHSAWVTRPPPQHFGGDMVNDNEQPDRAYLATPPTDAEVFHASKNMKSNIDGPFVGRVAPNVVPIAEELKDVRRAREIQRFSTVNWLRRVLSKVTTSTLAKLGETEDKFGDVVNFKGKEYAPTLLVEATNKARHRLKSRTSEMLKANASS